jgi:tetratricopeptide (TPR) repeat protein
MIFFINLEDIVTPLMPHRSRIKIVFCLCWLLTGSPILFAQEGGGGKDALIDSAMYFQEVKRDYPTALVFYRRALALDEAEHRPYDRILGVYAAILNVYFYLGDYPGAMEMVLQKLAVAEDHHDSLQMARSYNTIGFIYYRQGNISKSEVYYSLYLTLAEKAKDRLSMADAYTNIADIGVANMGRHCRPFSRPTNFMVNWRIRRGWYTLPTRSARYIRTCRLMERRSGMRS